MPSSSCLALTCCGFAASRLLLDPAAPALGHTLLPGVAVHHCSSVRSVLLSLCCLNLCLCGCRETTLLAIEAVNRIDFTQKRRNPAFYGSTPCACLTCERALKQFDDSATDKQDAKVEAKAEQKQDGGAAAAAGSGSAGAAASDGTAAASGSAAAAVVAEFKQGAVASATLAESKTGSEPAVRAAAVVRVASDERTSATAGAGAGSASTEQHDALRRSVLVAGAVAAADSGHVCSDGGCSHDQGTGAGAAVKTSELLATRRLAGTASGPGLAPRAEFCGGRS